MYMPVNMFTPTWPQRRFRAFARRHWGQFSSVELCARARIGRTTFYRWRQLPGFSQWLAEAVPFAVPPVPRPAQQGRGDSAANETVSEKKRNSPSDDADPRTFLEFLARLAASPAPEALDAQRRAGAPGPQPGASISGVNDTVRRLPAQPRWGPRQENSR